MSISIEISSEKETGGEPSEVFMFLDKEGLKYLIRMLENLSKNGDHIHLMSPSWGMDTLDEKITNPGNHIVHHLKLTLTEDL
jgi:hypothetical protein